MSGAESERGAERAKYSWSAERVFIQRPERSIHLCLQQLTKLSAYTSKIVHCEGDGVREIFPKANRQVIQVHNSCQKIDDNDVEHDQECGDTISVSKDLYFNLKRHIMQCAARTWGGQSKT